MDILYYVRNGERNEELRYSLRSLANIPHDRVYISGYTPSWVTGVTSIPGNLVMQGPQQTAVDNLMRGLDAMWGDELIIFNDDFYVMEPMDAIPSWHAGPLDAKVAITHGGYGNALSVAFRRLLERGVTAPLAWTLHIPVVVVRDALRAVLDGLTPDRRVLPEWRTMYGNLIGATGEQHEDCKVLGDRGDPNARPFLSSHDSSFHRVRARLHAAFPEPCAYEVAA